MVLIQFEKEVLSEKILHHLRHIKKTHPRFRQYVSEIKDMETLPQYVLKDVEGNEIAGCRFDMRDSSITFMEFRGDPALKDMLQIDLVQEIGEKAFATKDKVSLFFDLHDFYLCEKGKFYKLARDGERLIPIEKYHVPNELKNRENSDCG